MGMAFLGVDQRPLSHRLASESSDLQATGSQLFKPASFVFPGKISREWHDDRVLRYSSPIDRMAVGDSATIAQSKCHHTDM